MVTYLVSGYIIARIRKELALKQIESEKPANKNEKEKAAEEPPQLSDKKRLAALVAAILFFLLTIQIRLLAETTTEEPPQLEKGWNLVSVPCTVKVNSLSRTLLREFSYFTWDGEKYISTPDLERGRGYLVDSNSVVNISSMCEKNMVASPPEMKIQQGWNLVGNPYHKAVKIDELFAGHEDEIDAIFEYRGNKYVELEWTDTLKPWRGYWIYTEKELAISTAQNCRIEAGVSRVNGQDDELAEIENIKTEVGAQLFLYAFQICEFNGVGEKSSIDNLVEWTLSIDSAGGIEGNVFTGTDAGETILTGSYDESKTQDIRITVEDSTLDACDRLQVVQYPVEYPEFEITGYQIVSDDFATENGASCFQCGDAAVCGNSEGGVHGNVVLRQAQEMELRAYCIAEDENGSLQERARWKNVTAKATWNSENEEVLAADETKVDEGRRVYTANAEGEATISVSFKEVRSDEVKVQVKDRSLEDITITGIEGAESCGGFSDICEGSEYIAGKGDELHFIAEANYRVDGTPYTCGETGLEEVELEEYFYRVSVFDWRVEDVEGEVKATAGEFTSVKTGSLNVTAVREETESAPVTVMIIDKEVPLALRTDPAGPIAMFTGGSTPISAIATHFPNEERDVTAQATWDLRFYDPEISYEDGVLYAGDTPGNATVTVKLNGVSSAPAKVVVYEADRECESVYYEAYVINPRTGNADQFQEETYDMLVRSKADFRLFEICAVDDGATRSDITSQVVWSVSDERVSSIDGASATMLSEGVFSISASLNDEDVASMLIKTTDELLLDCDINITLNFSDEAKTCTDETLTICGDAGYVMSETDSLSYVAGWNYIQPEAPLSCRDRGLTDEDFIFNATSTEKLAINQDEKSFDFNGYGTMSISASIDGYSMSKTVRVVGENEPVSLALETGGDIVIMSYEKAPVKVTATYFDGRTEDVTDKVTWKIGSIEGKTVPEIVVENGNLTSINGKKGGEGELYAELMGKESNRSYLYIHDSNDTESITVYMDKEGVVSKVSGYSISTYIGANVKYEYCYESTISGDNGCREKSVDIQSPCVLVNGVINSNCSEYSGGDEWFVYIQNPIVVTYLSRNYVYARTQNYKKANHVRISVNLYNERYFDSKRNANDLTFMFYHPYYADRLEVSPAGKTNIFSGNCFDINITAFYDNPICTNEKVCEFPEVDVTQYAASAHYLKWGWGSSFYDWDYIWSIYGTIALDDYRICTKAGAETTVAIRYYDWIKSKTSYLNVNVVDQYHAPKIIDHVSSIETVGNASVSLGVKAVVSEIDKQSCGDNALSGFFDVSDCDVEKIDISNDVEYKIDFKYDTSGNAFIEDGIFHSGTMSSKGIIYFYYQGKKLDGSINFEVRADDLYDLRAGISTNRELPCYYGKCYILKKGESDVLTLIGYRGFNFSQRTSYTLTSVAEWEVSDTSVAEIVDGKIVAKKAGYTYIRGTYKDARSAKIVLVVYDDEKSDFMLSGVVNYSTMKPLQPLRKGASYRPITILYYFSERRCSSYIYIGYHYYSAYRTNNDGYVCYKELTYQHDYVISDTSIASIYSYRYIKGLSPGLVSVHAEYEGIKSNELEFEVWDYSNLAYCDSSNINSGEWKDANSKAVLETDCRTYAEEEPVEIRYTAYVASYRSYLDNCLDLYVLDEGNNIVKTLREEGCTTEPITYAGRATSRYVPEYQYHDTWDHTDDSGNELPPGRYYVVARFYILFEPIIRIPIDILPAD